MPRNAHYTVVGPRTAPVVVETAARPSMMIEITHDAVIAEGKQLASNISFAASPDLLVSSVYAWLSRQKSADGGPKTDRHPMRPGDRVQHCQARHVHLQQGRIHRFFRACDRGLGHGRRHGQHHAQPAVRPSPRSYNSPFGAIVAATLLLFFAAGMYLKSVKALPARLEKTASPKSPRNSWSPKRKSRLAKPKPVHEEKPIDLTKAPLLNQKQDFTAPPQNTPAQTKEAARPVYGLRRRVLHGHRSGAVPCPMR